jgi:uncharacterized membrane protein
MSLLTHFATALAPWADLYHTSPVTQAAVAFGHFGGMMTAGGFALAANCATLRAVRGASWEHRRHLRELAAMHPIVLGALAVTLVSGLLMFAADLETLSGSAAFWAKMILVGLLAGNGGAMLRAERSLRRGHPSEGRAWQRLRRGSLASLVLWFAVVLVGVMLRVAA